MATIGQALLIGVAAAGVVILGLEMSSKPPPAAPAPRSLPRTRPQKQKLGGTEALAWLSGNANTSAFASNAFGGTSNALGYVKRLYALGARKVTVGGVRSEPWRIQDEGGPYADTLFVTLPTDPAQIGAIQRFIQGGSYRPDEFSRKASRLRLWWD